MQLASVRDYLKTVIPYEDCFFAVHKQNRNKEKAFCIYYRSNQRQKTQAVGGAGNAGYEALRLTLLMRWGRDAEAAEEKAFEIYRAMENEEFVFTGALGFMQAVYDAPVWLGTDEKGVYEYAVDFDFYYERG